MEGVSVSSLPRLQLSSWLLESASLLVHARAWSWVLWSLPLQRIVSPALRKHQCDHWQNPLPSLSLQPVALKPVTRILKGCYLCLPPLLPQAEELLLSLWSNASQAGAATSRCLSLLISAKTTDLLPCYRKFSPDCSSCCCCLSSGMYHK